MYTITGTGVLVKLELTLVVRNKIVINRFQIPYKRNILHNASFSIFVS